MSSNSRKQDSNYIDMPNTTCQIRSDVARDDFHREDLDTGCFHYTTVTLLSIQSMSAVDKASMHGRVLACKAHGSFYHGAGQRIPSHSGQGIPVPYHASWSPCYNCVVTWNAIPVRHPRHPTYDSGISTFINQRTSTKLFRIIR